MCGLYLDPNRNKQRDLGGENSKNLNIDWALDNIKGLLLILLGVIPCLMNKNHLYLLKVRAEVFIGDMI